MMLRRGTARLKKKGGDMKIFNHLLLSSLFIQIN